MGLPYQQGHFDGACGFYSIVNAVCHLWPKADARSLFDAIAKDLINRGRLIAVLRGSNRGALNDALNTAKEWCATQNLPFQIFRPFWTGAAGTLREFREAMSNHFEEYQEKASAIIGYEYADGNPDYDCAHWTTVHQVTPKTLHIKDSSVPDKQVRFARCRIWVADGLSRHKRRPYAIDSASTFLLYRE